MAWRSSPEQSGPRAALQPSFPPSWVCEWVGRWGHVLLVGLAILSEWEMRGKSHSLHRYLWNPYLHQAKLQSSRVVSPKRSTGRSGDGSGEAGWRGGASPRDSRRASINKGTLAAKI